ncbi:TadE-like protein [Aeromicrobium marinum DSM 15272]|uniref:TadE-like protein n=1 Tax=Aeromicrobium marinum DSM 15272 TaxID=585531 RepID=E2SCX3_9ACTN|nr:TadE family protein [Aeromicrobium marinum]EFQ83076.1 TadE-like protein [Aeromicrobium marinum DSM 15272]
MRAPVRRRRGDERGSMAIEVVLLVPILVMFLLLVVAAGRYVTVRSDIDSAARDAARAASLERTPAAARAAAQQVAASQLQGYSDCQVARMGGSFVSGGVIDITLECRVSNEGLGLIGLGGSLQISGDASAPIDTYRRTG